MGGCGKRDAWAGRRIAGGARQRRFQTCDRRGLIRVAKETGSGARRSPADTAKGWRPEEDFAQGRRVAGAISKSCWNRSLAETLNRRAKASEFLKNGQPAISVDAKKKEQAGDLTFKAMRVEAFHGEWSYSIKPRPDAPVSS